MTPSLQLHSIHLRVPELARSLDFYAGQLGFVVVNQTANRAELATAPGVAPLLILTEDRSAKPAPDDAAGLFHAALLLPGRAALGRWLSHAANAGVNFTGFSDHGVSEAIYLSDPDGNGLEFYWDRPPNEWPRTTNGEVAMTTLPLEVDSLLHQASAASAAPATEGGRWGHLHLRVTELDRSQKFYEELLGVTLTQRYGTSARFLAADGYHHHLGLNTWGQPRRPRPAQALGLVEAVFARAGVNRRSDSEKLASDPDGIASRLVPLRGSS